MEEDDNVQIVIGTDTMSVGVDLTCVRDIVIIDKPEDVDDLLQKFDWIHSSKGLGVDGKNA